MAISALHTFNNPPHPRRRQFYKNSPAARQKSPPPAKPYKPALWPKTTPFWRTIVTIRRNTNPNFSL
jgi:hypothetical protein